ncbi:hypothetical protein J2847_003928 [Azospirillum agricola]|uniref:hypothetical protein n=1 Tax=Azospirillum agricola TaxID=1720247 RepID=UPI001AE968E4|nr:hypothetical protein [Azospirillum agricola]MBP2230623.1 hypothetical protein [Azospirillum agricola]
MRGTLAAAFLILATAGPAMAQQGLQQGAPQGRPAPIDLSACQTLTRHRPAPDVEYKPGVDVRGRPVAPADLPGSAAPAIDRFDIPVTLNLARRMGLHVPTGGLRGDTQIGWLTMDGNRLFFNGQPVGDAAQGELYAYCRAR